MSRHLSRTHRILLRLHRFMLARFPRRFPQPWALDAHETTRKLVAKACRRGWSAGVFTGIAECMDVLRLGLSDLAAAPSRLVRDAGYGFRRLRAKPLRALSLVLVLAVGIGASTAVFSVVNNTLLRPMMLRDIDRLVRIDDVVPGSSQTTNVSPLNASALAEGATTLDPVVVQDYRPFVITGEGEPERVRGAGVSGGFSAGLGVEPVQGRFFTADEQRLGEDAGTVLVSWELWQRRWGGAPDALRAAVTLNGTPRTIVGVMPRGFHFPYEADVWVPLDYEPTQADAHYLLVFGRIAPDRTAGDVQRELDRISAQVREAAPAANRELTMRAASLRDNLVRGYDRTALALLSVVGFLLLVGAVNVASLGLAEARSRAREMSIRSALGASRRAQIAQLLTETGLLALLGGLAGLGLARALRPLLSLLVPPVMSVELAQDAIVFDQRVLLFALGASVLAALVAGVLPATRAAVRDPATTLRAGGAVERGGRASSGLMMVGLELALAVVLLTGASAVTAAFVRDRARPLGYRPEGVLTLRTSLPEGRYPGEARRNDVVEALRAAVEELPGVASVGLQTGNPVRGGWVARASAIRPTAAADSIPAYVRLATPGVLESLDVPLLAGRRLDRRDDEGPPAVVVSRDLARRPWGDAQSAVGQRLNLPDAPAVATEWQVVGVCGDVREQGEVTAAVYLPYAKQRGRLPAQELDLFVRAAGGDAAEIAPAVRSAAHRVDPELALYGVQPLAEVRTVAQELERAGATLAAGFIGFGLLLSAIGVFGVVSNISAGAARAMSVRKALGARPGALLLAGLRPTVRAVAGGLAVGLASAWLVNRLLAVRVEGLPHPDAWLYALVAAVLGAVALAAALGPLIRSTRVDPARVLRES